MRPPNPIMNVKSKRDKRIRRHRRARAHVFGTGERPRLSIFRSNRHIWTQLVDDSAGKTIVAVSDLELKALKKTPKKNRNLGEEVGGLLAKKALAKKIVKAVFDRGGYAYHGVVKAVAEGARKGGLKF